MKQVLESFKEVYSSLPYLLSAITLFIILKLLVFSFVEKSLIIGIYGYTYYYIDSILLYTSILLFSLFLPASIYKFMLFNDFNTKEHSGSFLGVLLSILVAGCPACSITIATYVGLAGIIALFPYGGLELKILGTLLLIIANYSLFKNMKTCNVKSKKNKQGN